jgi:hypothetical protein
VAVGENGEEEGACSDEDTGAAGSDQSAELADHLIDGEGEDDLSEAVRV